MFVYCLNNPILHTDPSGTYATTKNEFSYNFYDEGLGGSGYAGGSGGGAIIIPEIVTLLEDTATAIIAAVATMANVLEYRGQHVYILTDPSDGLVKYVGRTNDPIRRLYEHQNDIRHPERKNYEMTVLMSGLTLDEARFYEQTLISAFTLGYLENARREISVGNMNKYWAYLDAASEVFGVSEMGLWDLLGGS